jgi:hypothetical protein
MMTVSTDRKKVLQIATLTVMQAMRAVVLPRVLRTSLSSSFAASLPTMHFKAALKAFVAEERALEDLGGLIGPTSLQSGFYAHLGQADPPLAAGRGMNS